MRALAGVKSLLQAAILVCTLASGALLWAADEVRVVGKVVDIEGKSVAGAELFMYGSPNTRRPADFISAKSGSDGVTVLVVPKGVYWGVARVRSGKFGPLQLGDLHSGEPTEIDAATADVETEFVVADIRDAGRRKGNIREGRLKVQVSVADAAGKPVSHAYVFADSNREVAGVPAYVSPWADSEGRCTLYLPAGKPYLLGAATVFPPEHAIFSRSVQAEATGELFVELVVNSGSRTESVHDPDHNH